MVTQHLVTGALFTVTGVAWTGIRAWRSGGVLFNEMEDLGKQDHVGLALLLIGALLLADGVRSLAGSR